MDENSNELKRLAKKAYNITDKNKRIEILRHIRKKQSNINKPIEK